jgi:hypothetical protein
MRIPSLAWMAIWIGCVPALVGFAAPTALRAASTTGVIAYVSGGEEIRLIRPDGSGDQSLWVEPNPNIDYRISDLDWRPDAGEIAFASNHEEACSIFDSDIYTIWPDGGGFRRVTNPPACAGLAGYAKGSVTLTLHNLTALGSVYVYLQGAPTAQQVFAQPNGSATTTFANVADFGDTLQQAVAIDGLDRWFAPLVLVDVKAGQTVHAGTLTVSGGGARAFGARLPAWRRDGGALGYIFGDCAGMFEVPPHPSAGSNGDPILSGASVPACLMDWGPTAAEANNILYYSYLNDGIYIVAAGSSDAGEQIITTARDELILDLQWLPDASGIVFTKTGPLLASANVYRYIFGASAIDQLTFFDDTFARDITISPDGQYIVFDRAATQTTLGADLWIMQQDGGGQQLLAPNGRAPSWSQQEPRQPSRIYVPTVQR